MPMALLCSGGVIGFLAGVMETVSLSLCKPLAIDMDLTQVMHD